MRGGHAGEPGVAARGGVEVREVRLGVCEEAFADEMADAAGFEGAGGLEVLELEEDAAEERSVGAARCWRRLSLSYHPAAFESAVDSIRGVVLHGLGISGVPRLPIVTGCFLFLSSDCRMCEKMMASPGFSRKEKGKWGS